MIGRILLLGITLISASLRSPCFGAEASRGGDSLVSCADGSKIVPEDRQPVLPDENLELLALRLSAGLYADHTVYNRLARDIRNIRALNSKMRAVHYFEVDDGRSLLLVFDASTLAKIKARQYDAWNCLNSYFGATVSDYSRLGYIEVRLRGRYKLDRIAESYKRLPGVTAVDTSLKVGDGSTIYVTRHASEWVYLFDIAGGDCPAGCTEHEIHYFEVDTNGNAREIAVCTNKCEPTPDWIKLYFRQYR